MGKRLALAGLLMGGGAFAWWLSRQDGGGLYAPIDLDYSGFTPDDGGDDVAQSSNYLTRLSLAEDPNQGLYTKNPYSTASGRYQFTKATWTGLGGDWGDDPTKAFGGLRPTEEEQTRRAQQLTSGNAKILKRAGLPVTDTGLYGVHIFGPKAVKALSADASTSLAEIFGQHTVAINPALGQTVGSFLAYLQHKVG